MKLPPSLRRSTVARLLFQPWVTSRTSRYPWEENSLQEANGHDLSKPSHVSLGAFSFRTPLFRLSLEVFDDLETSLTARGLFETFASDRVARGFGKLAINGSGDGVTGIKGIVQILSDSGSSTCYRNGFGKNTGPAWNGCEHHRLRGPCKYVLRSQPSVSEISFVRLALERQHPEVFVEYSRQDGSTLGQHGRRYPDHFWASPLQFTVNA